MTEHKAPMSGEERLLERQLTKEEQDKEAEARSRLEELIRQHRAFKEVINLISGEMLRIEERIWNHCNWMGLQGWQSKLELKWRAGE